MGYMDFTNSPAYQRAVQRMGRIRPEQRAIINSLSVDAKFADENTRKMLASLSQAQNKAYSDNSFALREKGLGVRETALTANTGLRRDAFDYNRDQDRMATGLGIGQVAAETKFGMDRDKIDMEILKKKMGFMNNLDALYGGR
uniref:Uncharacterized protein n=1 Tax=viral metagenome TaxID=1070528 RepID=A0A6M3JG80_9ZZZZ